MRSNMEPEEGSSIRSRFLPAPARMRNDPDSADRRGVSFACLACAQSGARTAPPRNARGRAPAPARITRESGSCRQPAGGGADGTKQEQDEQPMPRTERYRNRREYPQPMPEQAAGYVLRACRSRHFMTVPMCPCRCAASPPPESGHGLAGPEPETAVGPAPFLSRSGAARRLQGKVWTCSGPGSRTRGGRSNSMRTAGS